MIIVMKEKTAAEFEFLFERCPALKPIKDDIRNAYQAIEDTYKNGGKLLCAGNGGSCADSEHIVGELMKSFKVKRKIDGRLSENLCSAGQDGEYIASCLEGSLCAIALTSHPALSTAFSNDVDPHIVFAQQVSGFGKPGDTLLVISTSGNSKSCCYAAVTAKALGMKVIAMTGEGGGKLKTIADVTIAVPQNQTYLIQELHLPVYHALCAMLELEFFC